MLTIYALQLQNDKYYIGKTHRGIGADIRFQEHKSGHGSEWTKLYEPISILESYEHDSTFEEDVLTKKYMIKYGIENVRGGSYTKIILDEWQVKSLEHEFKSVNDACYKCGKEGHFASECRHYNMNLYLSNFNTEDEFDAEILHMTQLREDLQIKKDQINRLKCVRCNFCEGEGKHRKNIDKEVIIEPKMIDDFGFRNYKHEQYVVVQRQENNSTRNLYEQILQLLSNDGHSIRENVIENIYKIYIQRMKLEKVFKKLLEENNLSETYCIEEINKRIELLYQKYCKII
jgi:predicted GIY-YIG superfamily endonuclease